MTWDFWLKRVVYKPIKKQPEASTSTLGGTKQFFVVLVGFNSGYITWDDEDINNHNEYGGLLPDGVYDSNTKIYYCCRQVYI